MPKVVIDPGHGGHDPGASYAGAREADLNLRIARILRAAPAATAVKVFLTREDDRFLPLLARAEMANELGADIFLSIHCNASIRPEAPGFSVHHFPGAPRGEALARALHRALARGLPDRRDRGVIASSFLVLRRTVMPAALVECEFLSHPASRAWLHTPEAPERLAQAIRQGLEDFFHLLV